MVVVRTCEPHGESEMPVRLVEEGSILIVMMT
jgi:hypothetical protein